MASVPPVPAPVECAGARMHECSVLSCAWKAPRALTGSLASTARGHCAAQDAWRRWRCWSYAKPSSTRLEVLRIDHHRFLGAVCSFACGDHLRPNAHSVSRGYWNLYCKLSDSEPSDALSSESLWQDLKPVISYLPPEELDLVHRALKLAYEAHHGQKRRSGEPFIIHPVEVARILGELEVDWESVAAGLLHDTVEDTNKVTFEKIEKEFGVSVRNIVEGETKVSKLGKLKYTDSDGSKQDVKADDLRQMFLAMTEEVRVIIVKLADRLHNMRTLSHMPTDKQSSIAMETLQVFAPLAKLLGMYQIKAELESWSFMYTNPEDFSNIKKRVEDLYKEHEKELAEAKKFLKQKIEDDQFLQLLALKTEVHSVCKEPYSVYKAMLKSKSKIDEINLVAQICIVLQTKNCSGVGPLCNAQQICYHVLGLVHGLWTPIPTTMKDFIATPKQNGYQGLHTIVIPFLNESMFRVEVLIRTEDMDLIAQRGIAAHYTGRTVSESGKGRTYERILRTKPVRLNNADFALRISWLNAIREWQEEFVGNMTSREFVDTVLRDLLGSRVFVFTPKGEIKNLPRGATVIDYAYLIHTEVGNKMVAAKVNGNGVPLMHVLANAEVVEIITYDSLSSKSAFQRHQQWLQHAKTRSARHKIMKFLREQAGKSATEITADTVNNFVGDLIEENEDENFPVSPPKDNLFVRRQIILPMISNEELSPVMNSVAPPRKNKGTQDMVIKVNGHRKTGFYSSLPELENWKESKIVSWHSLGGHSIQWFCVVCIDRRGMMADVTSSLTAAGITICSCSAEKLDMGMGVMLFRIEGTSENLVNACSSIESIPGVGWSTGCSLYDLSETHKYI